MITPRLYQRAAVDATYAYWQAGGGNPLLVLPTGAGKSLVLALMIKELLELYPAMRIGVVTHSRELIVQNFGETLRIWPQAPVGIYSAGVGRRDARAKVVFMGIQSAYAKAAALGPFDLLVVDEAHLIPRSAATMYGQFIDELRSLTPDMRIVGLTATPYRLDSGRLDDGAGALFDEIVYEANVVDLIRDGYLSPLISKATANSIDVSGVHVRAGDYVASELETAAMKGDLVHRAVAEMVTFGADRRAWLAFCSGIAHAAAVAEAIRGHGILAEAIDGTMDKGTRDRLIGQFRNGALRCLTSVNVLSIGFNVPHVDMIALMRPTKSTGMYVQQVGRAFRIAEGKTNALILDYAGVVRRHGPVDAVSIGPAGKGKGKGEAADTVLAKECPDCHSLVALATRTCPDCGHEWTFEAKPKHEARADGETAVLSSEKLPPKMLPMVSWEFQRWQKTGSPDSVCVTYYAGIMAYREWLAFEHHGYPRQRAAEWWSQHGGSTPFPRTTEDALGRLAELTQPATISVVPNGKYHDIIGRTFPRREAAE